jgi:hypothetical protein
MKFPEVGKNTHAEDKKDASLSCLCDVMFYWREGEEAKMLKYARIQYERMFDNP